MKRAAYFALYGLFAAMGAGLLARPALLALKGLGVFAPVLPWDVPLGLLLLALLALFALFTLRLALRASLGHKPRPFEHVLFLALLSAALVARFSSGEPSPPADPTATLLAALRTTADAAEAHYARAQAYLLDDQSLSAALGTLPSPGFRYHGQTLPLRARVLANSTGPLTSPEPGELPGTVLVAVNAARTRCWLTVLTLRNGQPSPLGPLNKPIVLQARGGTHSAPGRDPLIPTYPGMKSVGRDH